MGSKQAEGRGLILCLLVAICGCNYEQVGSGAYELAVSLDQMFQRKDPVKLEAAKQLVLTRFEAGEITAKEEEYFRGMLDLAAENQWEDASQACRKLLKDQVAW